MPTVQDLLNTLESVAPSRYAFSFDKIGLQVGDPGKELKKGVVSLDRSLGAIEHCISVGADVLVAHHPLIFNPISTLDTRTHVGRGILALARAEIAFVAAHTNWDCARGGINDALAAALGLVEIVDFGASAEVGQLKLVVLCPPDATDTIIDAASNAGAGTVGLYNRCAFYSDGTGTFEPQVGANPFVGKVGQRESVGETRIEMILQRQFKGAVEKAVRGAHPYDEPPCDFVDLAPIAEQPIGRLGRCKTSSLKDFSFHVERSLGTSCWTWGNPTQVVKSVAVIGGGADDEWMAARDAGADVFITGEVHQHVALEAVESGLCLIAAGHYATEQPGCSALHRRLAGGIPGVDWLLYEPKPGHCGRPF